MVDTVTRRRNRDDMRAFTFLANFELRRVPTTGNFGVFLKGTNTQCGTVYKHAQPFLRAMMTLFDSAADPSSDRARIQHDGPKGIDPVTGKRHYKRRDPLGRPKVPPPIAPAAAPELPESTAAPVHGTPAC